MKRTITHSLNENNGLNNDDIDIKIWVKALLYSYKVFPNLINTIDKIIKLKASSMAYYSSIYNLSKSTKDQIENVIDLSERKKNLVNIYLMISKLLDCLTYESRELAEKKFIDRYTSDELSQEYGVSVRTIYRRQNKVIEEIFSYVKKMKWSLKFIEIQVDGEEWLYERFYKLKEEYLNDLNNASYNKSSSES